MKIEKPTQNQLAKAIYLAQAMVDRIKRDYFDESDIDHELDEDLKKIEHPIRYLQQQYAEEQQEG